MVRSSHAGRRGMPINCGLHERPELPPLKAWYVMHYIRTANYTFVPPGKQSLLPDGARAGVHRLNPASPTRSHAGRSIRTAFRFQLLLRPCAHCRQIACMA
jgi:hypothetical protein